MVRYNLTALFFAWLPHHISDVIWKSTCVFDIWVLDGTQLPLYPFWGNALELLYGMFIILSTIYGPSWDNHRFGAILQVLGISVGKQVLGISSFDFKYCYSLRGLIFCTWHKCVLCFMATEITIPHVLFFSNMFLCFLLKLLKYTFS